MEIVTGCRCSCGIECRHITASLEVAAAWETSEAATARASSELAAAAEAVRMAAMCEEVTGLKAELEQLDTLRKRLFAQWCDTHENLLDFKQACSSSRKGTRPSKPRASAPNSISAKHPSSSV